MATKTSTTRLDVVAREAANSRENRRLRRQGLVPGVLYGQDKDPLTFAVGARELSHALKGAGAVVELALDGQTAPAVVKDTHKHPVRGEVLHIDFLRVDLDTAIQATVPVTVTGGDDAPGVKEGGVLAQVTLEVTVEALPAELPEAVEFDASGLEAAGTATLADLQLPSGVTLVDDAETVLVTITVPTPEEADEPELEAETEVVGEATSGEDAGEGGEGESGDAAADAPEAE